MIQVGLGEMSYEFGQKQQKIGKLLCKSVRSSMYFVPANDVIGIFITSLLCRFGNRRPVNSSKNVSERT